MSLTPFAAAAAPRPVAITPEPNPAHDLRNHLAVIMGICEALAEELPEGSESAELARVGLIAAERACDLVERMRAADADEAIRPAAEGQPSVLVLDDDPNLLSLMTGAFSRAGFKAYAAQNGRAGLKMLETLSPDLVVTDIVMPEMEGLATIREVKRAAPATRVIAISGGGHYGRSDTFLTWAEGLGADEVLAKPFKMSSLLTAARLVLDQAPRQATFDFAFEPAAA